MSNDKQPGFWANSLATLRYGAEGAAETAKLTAISAKTAVSVISSVAESIEELGNNSQRVKESVEGFGRAIHTGLTSLDGFALRAVNNGLPNSMKMGEKDWTNAEIRSKRVFYASAGLDENGNPIPDPEDEPEEQAKTEVKSN